MSKLTIKAVNVAMETESDQFYDGMYEQLDYSKGSITLTFSGRGMKRYIKKNGFDIKEFCKHVIKGDVLVKL